VTAAGRWARLVSERSSAGRKLDERRRVLDPSETGGCLYCAGLAEHPPFGSCEFCTIVRRTGPGYCRVCGHPKGAATVVVRLGSTDRRRSPAPEARSASSSARRRVLDPSETGGCLYCAGLAEHPPFGSCEFCTIVRRTGPGYCRVCGHPKGAAIAVVVVVDDRT
jgi:hypothetical protein